MHELSGLLREAVDRAREISARAVERGNAEHLRRSFRAAFRAPRVEAVSSEDGGSTTRARRACGGAGTRGRVDRRARPAADPGGDGHDDHAASPRSSASTRSCSHWASSRRPASTRGARASGDWRCSRCASLGCGLAELAGRAAALPRAAGRRRRGGAARGLPGAGRGRVAVRPPPVARRGARRHRGRPRDRRPADRGLRLARDLLRPGAARRGRRARLSAAARAACRGRACGAATRARRRVRRPERAAGPDGGLWSRATSRRAGEARRATSTSRRRSASLPGAPDAARPARSARTRPPRGDRRVGRAERRRRRAPTAATRRASSTTTRPEPERGRGRRCEWGDASPVRARRARVHRRGLHRGALPARDRARGRVRDLAAARGARRLDPAARRARRGRDPRPGAGTGARRGGAAGRRRGRARLPARAERSRGRSCRSCSPARAWASRCPAYAGELLPEKTVGEAAVGLVARHAGIVVVLAILAPVATAKLESGTEQAILRGTALVLDAQIDPLQKLELAPALLDDVDIDSPRAGAHRRGRRAGAPSSPTTPRSTTGSRSGSTTWWSSPSRTRSRSST